MAVDFFKKFVNDLGENDTTLAAEGKSAAEFSGFIDTGSYTLNAALSGSIYGGIPNNKAVALAGEQATGKTFYALSIIKHFLESDKKARVFYFDTEAAVTNKMFEERGIDPARIAIVESDSIESFRTRMMKILNAYKAIEEDDRFPMMVVLDSLGNLPSKKEVEDITEGKDTRDMTKAQLLKGAFRVLRLKMGQLGVSMLVTNHVYAVVGAYVPTKEMSGGSGLKYAADAILFLGKSKDKEEKEVVGNIIHVTVVKSRLSRENTKVDSRIAYTGGLDRYFGLLPIAEAGGLVKKVANKYEFPDGTKAFEKHILANPEKFWTKDMLDKVEVVVGTMFKYLPAEAPADSDEEDDE